MTSRQQYDVVIVGGGAVGLSTAYHLARLGVKNVLLVERNTLTSGTSWHAAGIVGPLRASMNLTRLAIYALELFPRLEQETGQATGYQQTGGLWLGSDPSRITELKRIKAMGDMNDLHARMLSPDDVLRRCPHLSIDDLAGALWVEEDGQINPVDLCMAYARGARSAGVEIREHAKVTGFISSGDTVRGIELADGTSISCQSVVNCAGAWARDLGKLAGVNIPLAAVEHLYVVTEPIAGLMTPFPIVRDLDAGIYIKGDNGKLVVGTFEHNPKLWDPKSIPDDTGHLMFAEDWDHIEPMLEAAMGRIPELERHGITHFMNGPESFTPDTRQLMGETPELRNHFVAAGFNSIGVMSSAGVGKVMAQWVVDADAPMDLWEVDIARMDPLTDSDGFLAERIPESVHNQFAMHWPLKQFRSGRNQRRSPWHQTMASRGAVFGAPTGWERPLWFARRNESREIQYSYGSQCWWASARREALHMMSHVSLFELSPFSKIIIQGPDACRYLQYLCCNNLDVEPGTVVYTPMLNHRGGIEADLTVSRIDQDRFMLVGGAATHFRDLFRIRKMAASRNVSVTDRTEDMSVLGVMGPDSRPLLSELCGDDFSNRQFPFATTRSIRIAGTEVRVTRISFVGELGWEIYCPRDRSNKVLDAIVKAGSAFNLDYAGHLCLDACRLEKGYRHWGHDIGPDDTPLEAGLGFTVNWEKPGGFIGIIALQTQKIFSLEKCHLLFEVEDQTPLLLHDEPIYHDSRLIGRTTSGGLGFRTGKSLCFGGVKLCEGMEKNDLFALNLEIEIAGDRLPLAALKQSPYDPRGERLRG